LSRLGETFRGERLRELLIGGAHLGALWAFAFAWPLLDLLGKNPDFFVARSNTSGDIIIFALCFMLGPPLVMLALETLVAMISRTAYLALHLVLIGAMAAVFFVGVEKRIFTSPTALIIIVSLAFGAAVAYGLRRTRFVPSLLDVLAVAPVVFLVIFFFFSDTSKLILPQSNASALGVRVPAKTPVVEVIFDEFPTATLLDTGGQIDGRRFPHFAALARQSTWYPNNTTVADFTGRAVPAIMTGNNPSGSTLPIASDQPNSIFSLLGGAYRLHVKEVVTQVCPSSLCGEVQRPRQLTRLKSLVEDLKYVEGRIILPPSLANELPNVSTTFGNFGNNGGGAGDKGAGRFAQDLFTPPSPGEFEHFLDRIPGGDRTLSLIHMELPHEPWRYVPDGQNYLDTSVTDLATSSAARWAVGNAGIASAEARHYLQTGYADRLVGLMMARLKKLGIWKKAMVIVTADHGISFRGGKVYRRIAEPANLGGVSNPPLFIKYPDQTKGKTSPTHTQSIDILPTIAQQLGIQNLYKTEGEPIDEEGRGGEVAVTNGQGEVIRMPLSRMLRQRNAVVKQAFFRLGSGDLYHLGPAPELIGTVAPALSIGIRPGTSATVENGGALENVDPEAQEVPAFIAGDLQGVKPGTEVAVTVNGTVRGTGRAFLFNGELSYGVVVPPGTFTQGRNQIGVYEIGPGNTLTPLGGN
jgi:hypothetical protein